MLFFEILQTLCHSKQITPTEMARKIGISTAMPTNWKNGQVPNGETLMKLSDFFNVSVDYLLGREKTTRYEHSLDVMNLAQNTNSNLNSVIIPYSGNERKDTIAKEILKTDLTEDDLKLIEFILDKYKK